MTRWHTRWHARWHAGARRAVVASLLIAGPLSGCGDADVDRAAINTGVRTFQVLDGLSVRTQGAAVIQGQPAKGNCPPGVTIRAQSFDPRVDVESARCGAQALRLTISHLPGGTITRTARGFLGAVEARVAATQEVAGGGIELGYDIHDPQWTPLAPEMPFDARSNAAGESPGTSEEWTLCMDRNRQAWRLLAGHRPAAACRFPTVQADNTLDLVDTEAPCDEDSSESPPPLVDPAAGACTSFDAPNNDPIALAPLVVRHRLRLEANPACIRFAVLGNNAGNLDLLRTIVDQIRRADAQFAIVTGDSTTGIDQSAAADDASDQPRDGLAGVAQILDGLPVPWYATLGDRDISGDGVAGYARYIGASTFAFEAGPARLIVLDSADLGLASTDRKALARWLDPDSRLWWSVTPPPVRLVFTHVPPFDPYGARGDAFRHRPEAAAFIAALRRGTVPYVFSSQFAVYQEQPVSRIRVIHSGGAGAPMELIAGDPHHWLLVTVGGDVCTDPPPCLLTDRAACPCVEVTRIDVGGSLPDLPACTANPALPGAKD